MAAAPKKYKQRWQTMAIHVPWKDFFWMAAPTHPPGRNLQNRDAANGCTPLKKECPLIENSIIFNFGFNTQTCIIIVSVKFKFLISNTNLHYP